MVTINNWQPIPFLQKPSSALILFRYGNICLSVPSSWSVQRCSNVLAERSLRSAANQFIPDALSYLERAYNLVLILGVFDYRQSHSFAPMPQCSNGQTSQCPNSLLNASRSRQRCLNCPRTCPDGLDFPLETILI